MRYEEIAPFYRATYEAFGISAEAQHDDFVWESIRLPRPSLGPDLEVFLTRWLKVPNFAVYFGKQIETSPRLLLLARHVAVGFEGSSGRVSAVKVVDGAGAPRRIEGDCFIIAAGTIETSRLLLHSAAADNWDCPWRGNANVGAYFQDHLGARLGSVKPRDTKQFFNAFSTVVVAGQKFQPKIRLRAEAQERKCALGIHGILAFESSVSENLVYLKQFVKAALYSRRISGVGDVVRNAAACAKYLVPLMWRFAIDHRVFVPKTSKISLVMQSEQIPLADSRISIDPAVRDAWGLPAVLLDWRVSADQLTQARDFATRAAEALAQARLADVEIEPALLALDPKFLDTFGDTYHHAGGAVMGSSPADGVVDSELRVFGAENLYVSGAATFRTCGSANTTFTALAFATRLVYHLAKQYADDRLSAAR